MNPKFKLAILFVGLICAYFTNSAKMQTQSQLKIAKHSLEIMGNDANKILFLKHEKSKIPRELKRFDQANIIGFIESKIKQAGISKSSILRMNPSERVKDKKKHEVELKITVSLKNVEISKVFTFLYNLESAGIGLKTSSLRLDGASKQNNNWNVQAVISCFIKRS